MLSAHHPQPFAACLRSAAAAEGACELLAPELLSLIRLPSWRHILPPPDDSSPACDADAGSAAAGPGALWWQPEASSSGGGSSMRCLTTSLMCDALDAAAGASAGASSSVAALACDCCGASMQHHGTAGHLPGVADDDTARRSCDNDQQQQAAGPAAAPRFTYCRGCGVARYCSLACAVRDGSRHRRSGQCRCAHVRRGAAAQRACVTATSHAPAWPCCTLHARRLLAELARVGGMSKALQLMPADVSAAARLAGLRC